MQAIPFPKSLFERAVSLGVKTVTLSFEGGNDEGHLEVSCGWGKSQAGESARDLRADALQLQSDIEDWAFDAYDYSGAGDGSRYGDDVVYDLVRKTASTSDWYTSVVRHDPVEDELELDDDLELDEDN